METLSSKVAIVALIGSSYFVMTLVLGEFGYSWVQIRISEALTPLPFLMGLPAVAGLTIGCIMANLFSPVGLPDMVFGPLLTLLAAILSWKFNFGKRLVACAHPVLVNSIGVSAYVSIFYGVPYLMSVITIAIGEAIAAISIGYPLLVAIQKAIMRLNPEQNKDRLN